MDGLLKGLVAAACIAIIAAVGYYFIKEHRQSEAAELQAKRAMAVAEAVRLKKRVEEITPHCNALIDQVLDTNAKTPIKSTEDIPAEIREDISLCVRWVDLGAYEKHGLEYNKLARLWR
jgi:hypothetical protein